MGLKPIRKTANGMEYWDDVNKKVVIGGVDMSTGQDKTVEKVLPLTNENIKSIGEGINNTINTVENPLDKMNADQLLAFAESNNIEVPGNMKKEETIRNYIAEQLAAADKE